MSKKIYQIIFFIICFLSLQIFANAQSNVSVDKQDRNIIVVGAGKTLKVGGKVAYFVTKEIAKLAWKTTKFTAGEVAAPVAKAIIVKALPKVTVFALKQSASISGKLLIGYLKYKTPF